MEAKTQIAKYVSEDERHVLYVYRLESGDVMLSDGTTGSGPNAMGVTLPQGATDRLFAWTRDSAEVKS